MPDPRPATAARGRARGLDAGDRAAPRPPRSRPGDRDRPARRPRPTGRPPARPRRRPRDARPGHDRRRRAGAAPATTAHHGDARPPPPAAASATQGRSQRCRAGRAAHRPAVACLPAAARRATLRAAWLGAVRAAALKRAAATQQVEKVDLTAQRGTITDRNGAELAVSEDASDVYATPVPDQGPGRRRPRSSRRCSASPETELAAQARRPQNGFVYLARKVPSAQGAQIQRLRDRGHRRDGRLPPLLPAGLARRAGARHASGSTTRACSGIEQQLEDSCAARTASSRIVSDALGEPVSLERGEGRARARTCG